MPVNRESVEPKSHGTERGSTKNVVVIFTKVPVAGTVKTRLVQDAVLDAQDTALLAEAMLKDTIVLSAESNASEIIIGFCPADRRELMKRIVRDVVNERRVERPITLLTQTGANFDERFGSVVAAAFAKGSDKIVILGEDLPYLPPDVINHAFSALSNNNSGTSVVIGPAGEGGIYLVGITRQFDPESFSKNRLFSGGVEISQFVQLCKSEGRGFTLLPAYADIDVEEDLVSLLLYINAMKMASKSKGFYFPRYTADAIIQLGLTVVEQRGKTRRRRIGRI